MNNNSHYGNLKMRLESRNRSLKEKLLGRHREAFEWAINNTRQLAAGAMGSVLLLSSPTINLLPSTEVVSANQQFVDVPDNLFVVSEVNQYLPSDVGKLLLSQEEKISEILSKYYGFDVRPEINGMRLEHTYGYIGAEQHLMRYPGDTMDGHFANPEDQAKFYSSGMAPGRGAFGYFARSKQEMTQKEIDREKYYIAVQTFLVPEYATHTRDYVEFFKYRKMLVFNPNTGRAVVVVIGDAGPAVWTKKHLGGSPEVMKHLQRVDGKAKGTVLYFFIDDPEDKIPLGPIEPTRNE
ncbi:MAG: hypothetical protein Q7T54_03295 [Candidatus Levybacteria bacterium]|nr:hypothetical protein [Candidatus Levybacteria bacterium]